MQESGHGPVRRRYRSPFWAFVLIGAGVGADILAGSAPYQTSIVVESMSSGDVRIVVGG